MSNDSKIEVLKAGDIEGMIAYATGKPRASAPATTAESAEKPATEGAAPAAEPEEDENGLTEADRKELTQRHQRAMGRKHRQYKDADERAIKYHAESIAEKQAREAAERRAEAAERKAAELEAKVNPAKAAQDEDAEPVYVDGDSDFLKKWGEWNRRQALKEFRAEQAKQQAQEREASALKTAQDRIARAQQLQPDWAEAVGAVTTPIPPAIGAYMHESEMIGEIAYYFAKHPKELESLGKLTPTQQLVAIGKIESKLAPFAKASASAKADPSTAEAPPAPKPSTTAPAPRQPPEVPILSQVPSGTSDSQVEGRLTVSDAIAKFERDNGVNLSRRRRS